jgi:hypothetical protein
LVAFIAENFPEFPVGFPMMPLEPNPCPSITVGPSDLALKILVAANAAGHND